MTRMKNPAHPGRIVASAIKDAGWTVTHAAERLGVTRAFLSRILHGHASITAATALRLEALGWSDAEHWMRMQTSYDLAKDDSGRLPEPAKSPSTFAAAPVARLVPCEPRGKRRSGAMKGQIRIDDGFFDPLPEDELDAWEGR